MTGHPAASADWHCAASRWSAGSGGGSCALHLLARVSCSRKRSAGGAARRRVSHPDAPRGCGRSQWRLRARARPSVRSRMLLGPRRAPSGCPHAASRPLALQPARLACNILHPHYQAVAYCRCGRRPTGCPSAAAAAASLGRPDAVGRLIAPPWSSHCCRHRSWHMLQARHALTLQRAACMLVARACRLPPMCDLLFAAAR